MNLLQAAPADQASVSKRTVERLESGAVATQLSGFLRVCRVLGLVEHFENWILDAVASPMEQLKHQAQNAGAPPSKKR
jgi:predicted transcriptional regulator